MVKIQPFVQLFILAKWAQTSDSRSSAGFCTNLGSWIEKPSALWSHLTSFRRKGRVGVNMSFIPYFDTPSVEGDMYLCWKNSAERNKGVDCAFAKLGPLESAISRRRLEYTLLFYSHPRKRYVFGAGKPEQRRMRPRTASHCVFAKWDLE